MLIGITGSIGCGKTTVGEILKSMDFLVLDCDNISHDVIKKGRVGYYEVLTKISHDVLDSNNEIDRKKLGEIVFSDPEKRVILEKIIHPKVKREIRKYRKCIIAFIETPLLFEAKMEKCFDKIIVVETTLENQILRLKNRDNLNEEEILKRINTQMPIANKIALADYVIHNSLDIRNVTIQINKILEDLKTYK